MLDYLASLYEEIAGPDGIPWDGLLAKGHGITENGYDAEYMQLLLETSFQYFDVLGSLNADFRTKYRTIRDKEARVAITQMMALVNQTGTDIWQAVKDGDFDAMVRFPQTIATDAFATLAATATNGAYLHFDGVVEQALRAGRITAEEAMQHADSVMKTFQTFIDLSANGHLDQLKVPAPEATSGLGLAPLVIGGWAAALGIVLVLGLCYCYYIYSVAGPVQDKLFEWCDKLSQKGGTEEDLRACVAAATSIAKGGNASLGNFMGDLIKPLAVVLGIGAAIYLGSQFLPPLLARRSTA